MEVVEKDMESRLRDCIAAIDEMNAADPASLEFEGDRYPQALLEGRRAQLWVEKLRPAAGPPLRLAARAHHIRRWEVPRDSFPRTRAGYLAWRKYLYSFHADILAGIMAGAGFGEEEVQRAGTILRKKGIKLDPDVQSHEDAVSLAFLEVRLEHFIPSVSDEQLLRALRRTWAKMSPAGQAEARSLVLSRPAAEAVRAALDPTPGDGR